MQIWFDEVELTQLFKVVNIRRSIMPERENFSTNIPSMHGEIYTGYQYKPRKVEVDILIIADALNTLQDFKKGLAFMLDLDAPAKLLISDEPNKFLYAVIDGNTDIDEILKEGRGTLTFIAHDPFYYSTVEKEFLADTNSKMVIDNEGTLETAPRFEMEFTDDCGFISVVSPDGIIQIGNPKQIDVASLPKQERLVNLPMTTTSGWTINSADTKTKTSGASIQGSIGTRGTPVYALAPSSYGTPTNGWSGASMRRNLPASKDTTGTARYFETTVLFEFKSEKGGQVTTNTVQRDIDASQKGILEISITDENNDYLAGIKFSDSTVYHDMTVPEFWVGGQQIWKETLKAPTPKKVKYTYKEKGKVKTGYRTVYASDVGKWNDFYGTITIKKYWDRIVFDLQKLEKVNGKFKVVARKTATKYLNETQKNQRAKTLQAWFGRYGNEPFIDKLSVTDWKFNKLNTISRVDLDNTFQAGDKLVIDCDSSQVYLNDVLFMEDVDIGSEFFEVVSGETEVKLMHSSFTNKPTFKAYIRERWL